MNATWLLLACVGAAACGGPPAEAPKNATPPAAPTAAIPQAGRVAIGDPTAADHLRILVAPSGTYFERDDTTAHGRAVDIGVALGAAVHRPIVFIETPEDKLIPDLLAGKGDVAANLLLTFERDDKVAFAKPIRSGIRELVITGPKEPPLVTLEDVGGRTIHVRGTSDHHASLVRLNAQLKGINRPPAHIVVTNATDEALLEMVNSGKIPATIADDYIFDLWSKRLPDLKANRDVAVSQDGVLAWVTRKDNVQLLENMNALFSLYKVTFP